MTQASLIASLAAPPSPTGVELSTLPDSVEWLEVRSDLVGDLNPEWLRKHFRGHLLYALRSRNEGGKSSDSLQNRHRRLKAAAPFYDRVELESNTDCSDDLLAQIPFQQRCVSWHGPAADLVQLKTQFEQLSSVPAAVYKVVTKATEMRDEFIPLSLLKALDRSDTIAYSIGPLGFWSRLVALQLGAPGIYGLVPQGAIAQTGPTINQLIDDYGLPGLRAVNEIFAIIGKPIFHSLSPRLHNAAYCAMNYPALFLPLQVESYDEFWQEVVCSRLLDSLGFSLNGMTVASPHKEATLLTARMISPMSRQAESANILVRHDGWWKADTTDPEVVYMASRERSVKVRHKRAAVIGCGGAGRAIAAALVEDGAVVTLINRGPERGQHASEILGLAYLPLKDFSAEGYDIVVNATPVGRESDEVPFNLETLNEEAVVIDLVYGARPTPLVKTTLARDQIAIDGRDVLLTQVLHQFRLMTGKEMSATLAAEQLGRRPTTGGSLKTIQAGIRKGATDLTTGAN
ncbi:MAG: type I 3-dehydroquinate dehydratase [Pyrinomonadaceae bacterium]|nr:type I 3-dehydroquinate dehydratase [Pyrinomonadaceae bacterium]